MFLLRANKFLREHLVEGIQVVENVVKTQSYVAFLRMSELASLLLFEYLDAHKLEYNSSKASRRFCMSNKRSRMPHRRMTIRSDSAHYLLPSA